MKQYQMRLPILLMCLNDLQVVAADEAVANEDYELAAKIRDEISKR